MILFMLGLVIFVFGGWVCVGVYFVVEVGCCVV